MATAGSTVLDVLHVVGVNSDGGVPHYVEELVTRQQESGLSVAVACDPRGVLWARLASHPVDVRLRWKIDRYPQTLAAAGFRLRKLVRANPSRAVHMHSSYAGLVGRCALWGGSHKQIFQPHSWSFHAISPTARPLARALEWLLACKPDMVVCGSEAERRELSIMGVEPRGVDIQVIPNFVDNDRFCPVDDNTRTELQLAEFGAEAPTVVCVARLAPQKGVDRLIRAFAHVKAELPEARLVLVGDGHLRARYAAAAGPGVQLVGPTEEPEYWMRLAHLGVYPSRYDTMSLAVLETLACGVPVLTSDAGGMAEILDGATGVAGEIIADPDDSRALAEAIVAWLSLVQQPHRLAARQQAAGFDVEDWFDTMKSTYERLDPGLIGESPGRPCIRYGAKAVPASVLQLLDVRHGSSDD